MTTYFTRNCPNCQGEIQYKTKKPRDNAERKASCCARCLRKFKNKEKSGKTLLRECPKCKKTITHTNSTSFEVALKKQTHCKSCSNSGEKNAMFGKRGELNPFYGRSHSEESKKKMLENRDYSVYKTPEFREKQRINNSGEKANMYGKSIYIVWLEKHGKEIADEKMEAYRKKVSFNTSGSKNPMYGKPSPQGSGNGWKGWYKGVFFRSLREFIFLHSYIERFGFSYQNLEQKKFKIPYVDPLGDERNCFGDFLLNDRFFVEIKPKRLQTSPKNLCKRKAMEEFCNQNGYVFKMIDPKINFRIVQEKFESGELVFQEVSKKKFIEYAKNQE